MTEIGRAYLYLSSRWNCMKKMGQSLLQPHHAYTYTTPETSGTSTERVLNTVVLYCIVSGHLQSALAVMTIQQGDSSSVAKILKQTIKRGSLLFEFLLLHRTKLLNLAEIGLYLGLPQEAQSFILKINFIKLIFLLSRILNYLLTYFLIKN